MQNKQTILLTGATGFLGSHLLEALLQNDYRVVILKRSTSDTWRINHLLDQVKSYDVDTSSLHEVFTENTIDVIIHLATLYRKFDSDGADIMLMIEANINFPIELLELGVRNGVKRFINTGTFFEYDCSQLPVNEQANIKPFNFYAKTKLAFDAILATYADKLCIRTLRLFSPYGEKDNDKIIPMIIKKALSNDQIELSDGFQKLDFIYVADIVDAYIKAVSKMKDGQVGYKIYNIGSGVGISIREVISVIEQNLGKTINKVWGNPSIVDAPIVFADITYAKINLGWQPKTSIHEGIEKSIQYYDKERLS